MQYALEAIGSYAVVLKMRDTHRWWEPHSRHDELPLIAHRKTLHQVHSLLRLSRDLHLVIMGFLNPHYYAPINVKVKTNFCTLGVTIHPNSSIADLKERVQVEYMRKWASMSSTFSTNGTRLVTASDGTTVVAAPEFSLTFRLIYSGAVLQPQRLVSTYFIHDGTLLQLLV